MTRATIRFHEFELGIEGDDPATVAAIERRFAAGPAPAVASTSEVLRFVVRSVRPEALPRPGAGGRLVYESPRGRAYWYDDGRLELELPAGHAVCRTAAGVAELTVVAGARESVWAASRPLFTLTLAELLKQHGLYFLHAGAVQGTGGSLLLPGDSGAGKSTLTAALARSGAPLLGDDSVFLANGAGGLEVRSFPDELDLSTGSLELLGLDAVRRTRLDGVEKWQVAARDAGIEVGDEVSRPRALVFPVLGGDRTRLEEIADDEALLQLTPNVLLTSVGAIERHFEALAHLATLPTYRLLVGPRLAEAVDIVREVARD